MCYFLLLAHTNYILILQSLQAQVNSEVMEFTRYLQEVARICADDYLFIPEGAMKYSEVPKVKESIF